MHVALVDDAVHRVRETTGIRVDRAQLEEGLGYPVREAHCAEVRGLLLALRAVVDAATTRPPCTRITRSEHL